MEENNIKFIKTKRGVKNFILYNGEKVNAYEDKLKAKLRIVNEINFLEYEINKLRRMAKL